MAATTAATARTRAAAARARRGGRAPIALVTSTLAAPVPDVAGMAGRGPAPAPRGPRPGFAACCAPLPARRQPPRRHAALVRARACPRLRRSRAGVGAHLAGRRRGLGPVRTCVHHDVRTMLAQPLPRQRAPAGRPRDRTSRYEAHAGLSSRTVVRSHRTKINTGGRNPLVLPSRRPSGFAMGTARASEP